MMRQCCRCLEYVRQAGPVKEAFSHMLLFVPGSRRVSYQSVTNAFAPTYPDIHTLYPEESEGCVDVVHVEETIPMTEEYARFIDGCIS